MACDEQVISGLSDDARADYSQALLSVSVRRRRIAPCPLAFGEAGVKERVFSVLHYRKPAFWVVIVSTVLCMVMAVCFLTDPVRPSQEVLPEIHSHSFGVAEVVYEPLNVSMSLTPQINTPSYAVTDNMELILHWELTDFSGIVGTIREFALTRENFDQLFEFDEGWNGETARSIRRNAKRAWMVIHEQDVLHYLIQMGDGSIFAAYGYYDYAEKNDPGSDDTAIHWLFRLAIDVEGDYGVTVTSGVQTVPLTVFPEGTAVGNYRNAVHWLTVDPGEDSVPFRVYRDGVEFSGHYLAFDAETYQELSYHVSSGLEPQTWLFQNADPTREYIVLMLTGEEGADQYCFGVRFPEYWDEHVSTATFLEPMINVGGYVYVSTEEAMPAEIEPLSIIGKIHTIVDPSEEPTQNGQANFRCVGADYTRFEDGYAVLINGEWIRFVQKPYPKYYLKVGEEGVAHIEVSAGSRGLNIFPNDMNVFRSGEVLYLDGLDGLRSLRGVSVTAKDGDGDDLFSVRIADSDYETEDTIVCDDWIITVETE